MTSSGTITGMSVKKKKAQQLPEEDNLYLPEYDLVGSPADLNEFLLNEGLTQDEVDSAIFAATSQLP